MAYILGNWKMNLMQDEARALAAACIALPVRLGVTMALFPPFTALAAAQEKLAGSPLLLGAQDCSPYKSGAYTGDVSAAMLADLGCRMVILGHSERRARGETDGLVKSKAIAALEAGLTPVICVGETLEQRKAGSQLDVVAAQVQGSLPSLEDDGTCLIAYEPVWAIGSGLSCAVPDITEMHKTIASVLKRGTSGARTSILYGGSVKAASAEAILSAEGVGGVLVGGASLLAAEFGAIAAAAK